MSATFNINTSALSALTDKLQRINRSAFPVAIRGTLNGAAFDVKKTTMPASAAAEFTQRNPRFFKSTSKVVMAKGFDVPNMRSEVGFTSAGNNQAIDDLEQQEHGGRIKGRSFLPLDTARAGGSNSRPIRPNARLKQINNIVNVENASGKNDKEKFVKSALHAGRGGILLTKHNGKQIMWRVNSLTRTADGKFKLTPLYTYDKGRDVGIKPTNFMAEASQVSAGKIETLYIKEANRQFAKVINK